MSDAKRFEDWIIFDAHEYQYPNEDSMSDDALVFLLELEDLRKFKAGVPWMCIRDAAYGNTKAAERVQAWWRANNPNLTANAPKEPHA